MIALPVLAAAVATSALTTPDPAPLRAAIDSCDRGAVSVLNKADAGRRAAFLAAAYAEQRAIADERARLDAVTVAEPGSGPEPAARGTMAETAARDRTALDARQRRLQDVREAEQAWREALRETVALLLDRQCTPRSEGEARQP